MKLSKLVLLAVVALLVLSVTPVALAQGSNSDPCGGSSDPCDQGKGNAAGDPCGGSDPCDQGSSSATGDPCGGSSDPCDQGKGNAAGDPCGGSDPCDQGSSGQTPLHEICLDNYTVLVDQQGLKYFTQKYNATQGACGSQPGGSQSQQ